LTICKARFPIRIASLIRGRLRYIAIGIEPPILKISCVLWLVNTIINKTTQEEK